MYSPTLEVIDVTYKKLLMNNLDLLNIDEKKYNLYRQLWLRKKKNKREFYTLKQASNILRKEIRWLYDELDFLMQ